MNSRRSGAGMWRLLYAASLLALSGCFAGSNPTARMPSSPDAPGRDGAPSGEQDPKWSQAAQPGQPVLLRLKRTAGRLRAYEGTYERRQEGANRYEESAHFYISFACAEHTAEGFDLVSLQRAFLEHKRKEWLENGRVVDRDLPPSTEVLDLGPDRDPRAEHLCYAFDARNRMAFKGDEQPPLIMQGDTPHYFFPILPARAVAPGETWSVTVPVIIPDGLASQFPLRVSARVREVRGQDRDQVALVDYQFSGRFDSAVNPFAARFYDEFHRTTRALRELSGSGWLSLHIARGVILEKQEDLQAKIATFTRVPQPPNVAAKQSESVVNITSKFQMKWLPPGSRLRNGDLVPED